MHLPNTLGLTLRRSVSIPAFCAWMLISIFQATAHPLGNFSFNHFVRIETGADRVKIRYVVDLAEVPAFQEAQKADTDQNGSLSGAELATYLDSVTPGYLSGLKLTADGTPVALKLQEKHIGQPPGAAGSMALRMVFDLTGDWTASPNPRLVFQNTNLAERAGWREILVTPMSGVTVFDSTAFGSAMTDELKAYPEDLLAAPLDETRAEWSVTRGPIPASAKPLTLRDGKPVAVTRDRFAELITVENLVFSLGLSSILTAVGLAFVYGGKILDKATASNHWIKVLPIISALAITILGAVICYQALQQTGVNLAELWSAELEEAKSLSAMAILGLGLVIGLRHALDTDHLAAVSTIVSERKNLFSSLLVGGLWGLGHTVSLLIAGIAVIFLNLNIEKYEKPLEFCVALMLIGLGLNVLVKLVRGGKIHFHEHEHGGHHHVHPHLHDGKPEPELNTHHGLKLSVRPLVIGMVHGLAGSAALMLAVLATIKSSALAFGYIIIFGIGSIGGMMIMSLILSLPLHLTAASFTRTNWAVRALSGVFSLGFGLFMAYELGFTADGIFR